MMFINTTEFIPQEGIELTAERIILISATFVQLTFGLEKKVLDHFTTIYVYPKVFINEDSLKLEKGETNAEGTISLSWDNFEQGIIIPDDAINLGLHEMTHALYFEIIMERYKDPALFRAMMAVYSRAKNEVNYPWKRCELLRKYAYVNPQEYIAVAVEHFFEVPELLVQAHPALYKELALMLNQNPMRHVMANSEAEPSKA
jgi:MtfA peptidase